MCNQKDLKHSKSVLASGEKGINVIKVVIGVTITKSFRKSPTVRIGLRKILNIFVRAENQEFRMSHEIPHFGRARKMYEKAL